MADPIETTADADVRRELKEAADAAAKAARTRNAADIADAVKEGGEAAVALARSGWSWQQIAFAVVATVATLFVGVGSVAMVMSDANPPAVVNVPVKTDPDIAKLLDDGFKRIEKATNAVGVKIDTLGKKIDEKPTPVPVDPDKPKPVPPAKKLTLPERVEVAVGSVVKVKATGSATVQWTWRDSPGLDVDKHGSTLYVSAEKDGVYWVFAYTSADGKVGDIAACMIVAGKGPQPPPGPTPEPKPPTPKVDSLSLVILYESADTNSKTAKVVADYAFWESLKPLGVKWFKIDKDQRDGNGAVLVDSHNYRQYMTANGLPCILYMDQAGLVLKATALPEDTAAVRSQITALMGK